MDWNYNNYLEMFNVMDDVNTPKQKYVLFHGFAKGIMYSELSDNVKVKYMNDMLAAFDESLKGEYKKKESRCDNGRQY